MRFFMLAVCVSAVAAGPVSAQTLVPLQTPLEAPQTTARPTTEPTFVNLSGYSNDYQIGPGDLLDVQIVGQGELTQGLRVSNAGEISHQQAGLMKVVDLTAFEVEDLISTRLREKGLMQQAQVLVTVREYQAKPVYVTGAVVNPGEFIMSQELTVADAVLLAGGLQFNAANEGFVHRRTTPQARSIPPEAFAAQPDVARPGVEIIKIDLLPLREGRFQKAAIPLKRGDVVVVPQLQLSAFFVVGEVIAPRNYNYNPKQILMASQAISWAGGPTHTAKMSEGILVRYDEQGGRTEMKVDYAAILNGRQQDFPIQANDLLFIPGSKVKTIAQGMLGLTDTMVMSTSFRIARSYQMPDAPDRDPR